MSIVLIFLLIPSTSFFRTVASVLNLVRGYSDSYYSSKAHQSPALLLALCFPTLLKKENRVLRNNEVNGSRGSTNVCDSLA